jgi:hypothetical protein
MISRQVGGDRCVIAITHANLPSLRPRIFEPPSLFGKTVQMAEKDGRQCRNFTGDD